MEEIREISRIKIVDNIYDIKDEELRQMIGDPTINVSNIIINNSSNELEQTEIK